MACGRNNHGQCDLPEAEVGIVYVPNGVVASTRVMQLFMEATEEGFTATCRDLQGAVVATRTIGTEELQATRTIGMEELQAHAQARAGPGSPEPGPGQGTVPGAGRA